MENGLEKKCKKAILAIRDMTEAINYKLSHMLEYKKKDYYDKMKDIDEYYD